MKKIEIFVGSDSAFEKIVPKSARNLSEMAAKLDDGNKKMDVFVNIPGQPEPKPKKKKKPRVQDFVIHADEYCSVQEHVIINFINFIFQMSITNMYIQNPPKSIREQIYRTFNKSIIHETQQPYLEVSKEMIQTFNSTPIKRRDYMDFQDIIIKKRDKQKLTKEEISFFIQGVTDGSLPDYQISALLMAILLNGMDAEETAQTTMEMALSGALFDLSSLPGFKVDKHSTGGVGDTTTLILAPLVASLGVPVVKMSGRGLGFSGGTIDKLESIPGFQVGVTEEDALTYGKTSHLVLMSQTDNLTPADKKLYALRDVTGTVDSIPLIAASIMSKKIAAGADGLIVEVHNNPKAALCDGAQSLTPDQYAQLVGKISALAPIVERCL